ncbi:hypothetical protein JMUB7507_26640 [Staphylococcus aureus]
MRSNEKVRTKSRQAWTRVGREPDAAGEKVTGGAGWSEGRVVRGWVKCRNERKPEG